MALIPTFVRRAIDAAGDKIKMFKDGATDENVQAVAVVDSDGNQITSFGSSTVSVDNFPASQQIHGSGPLGVVPVLGPLTDTELRASDVKITLDGEQVAVSNFPLSYPVTGPLTDALLRAKIVDVDNWVMNEYRYDGIYWLGFERADGNWLVRQMNQTKWGWAMVYAGPKNNVAYPKGLYALAWANRGALIYTSYAAAVV